MAVYKPRLVVRKGGKNKRVFVRILKSSEFRQVDLFPVVKKLSENVR